MSKRHFLFLCLFVLFTVNARAQCMGGRYLNEIFPTITLDSVIYSTPYNLKMDIYQPAGDTLSARPLIILAHEGSFVGGDRESDSTVHSLCVNFAERGYVTASIDYRLTDYFSILDSALAVNEVIQAISDGKAAIRYFMQDRATANNYKIDTDNIFIGGNSAGAVLYMHVGYLDSLGECPPNIANAMNANGGFEGNSGNPGYTTRSKAIINLAGGLNETSFAGPGDKPSVNAQGTEDDIVPYNCGYPLGGLVLVNLCGLGALEPVYDTNDIYHMSHVFVGDSHVPWDTDPAKFYTVDSMVTIFLYDLVCTGVAGVNEVVTNPEISLFPNPAGEAVNIQSPQAMSSIVVYDETGRTILQVNKINRESYEANTSHFGKGVYFIRVSFCDAANAPVVKRVVVE